MLKSNYKSNEIRGLKNEWSSIFPKLFLEFGRLTKREYRNAKVAFYTAKKKGYTPTKTYRVLREVWVRPFVMKRRAHRLARNS